jgi:hypothetical protein
MDAMDGSPSSPSRFARSASMTFGQAATMRSTAGSGWNVIRPGRGAPQRCTASAISPADGDKPGPFSVR